MRNKILLRSMAWLKKCVPLLVSLSMAMTFAPAVGLTGGGTSGGVLALGNGGGGTIEFDCQIDSTGWGPWMFDLDADPYVFSGTQNSMYAYKNLIWNTVPLGTGNCNPYDPDGSGQASFGDCTAENTTVQDGIVGVTMELSNFTLAAIQKRNWNDLNNPGQSGDHREYTGGVGTVKVAGQTMLTVSNSRISMDVDWPIWNPPLGPGDNVVGSGWGTIDAANSDDNWEAEFDNGNGQVEFVFTSFSAVVQSCWGVYQTHVTLQAAPHVENMQVLPINAIGAVNFPQAGIALNVTAFTKGGVPGVLDQNNFFANRILANPGGEPPAGINQIIPACYWELGTVLDAINTSVTFDLTGISGITNPANLRILKRESALKSWERYNDYTLVDATHIRANNLTSFSDFALGVAQGTPVHNITTGENFATIQAAIDDTDTQNGHAIRVDDGTYTENVNVTKQLTIEATSGTPTVIAADANDHVFEIQAGVDNVTISGFNIIGATGTGKAGIYLGQMVDHCTITSNLCGYGAAEKNDIGIYLSGANDNTITDNTCSFNTHSGIYLLYVSSTNNAISGNNCNYNGTHGIYLYTASENTVSDNTCTHNTMNGIYLDSVADRNNISGNICESNSDKGIYLNGSNYNNVSGNSTGANVRGIYLEGASNNTIGGNCIGGNSAVGVQFVSSSQYNTFIDNDITVNGSYGIYPYSNNNTIYLNTFSNPLNVFPGCNTNNFWSSPTKISYTYNGTSFFNYLGNYYGNYDGTDGDGDGIGDTAYDTTYQLDDDDLYPLKDNPSEAPEKYTTSIWYLSSMAAYAGTWAMYKNDLSQAPKALSIAGGGGAQMWVYSQAYYSGASLPAGSHFDLQLTFTSAPLDGHNFAVNIFSSSDGVSFNTPMVTLNFAGDGSKRVFALSTTGAIDIPAGGFLGMFIVNNSPNIYSLQIGGAWSYLSTLPVVVAASETISTPATPTGPATGLTGSSLSYSTGGAISSYGHNVEYQFDWGDGSFSNWAAATSAAHTYTTANTYQIKAQARCAVDTTVVSEWSGARSVVISAPSYSGTIWYVSPIGNDSTGNGSEEFPYRTIGKAITQASAGHTVKVKDDDSAATDDYVENITVDKSLTIERYNATGDNPQVKAANINADVFSVTANNVTIRGLDIYGTGVTNSKAGIKLSNVTGCLIENNRCGTSSGTDNDYGILLYRGSNHRVINNQCIDNNEGIRLVGSDNNVISGNFIQYSELYDIYLEYQYPDGSDNNVISGNTCTDGDGIGIYVFQSNFNTICNNTIKDKVGTRGIELYSAQKNTIIANTISNIDGLYAVGIKLGLASYPSNDNLIYLNTFSGNEADVLSDGSTNIWFSPTPLQYTYQSNNYQGYLGNKYGGYNGLDNASGGRTAGDGVGDTAIPVTTDGAGDSYPLMASTASYDLRVWYLSNPVMYLKDPAKVYAQVAIPAQGSVIWKADQPEQSAANVPSEPPFRLMLEFATQPSAGDISTEIGYSTDGTDFTAGGSGGFTVPAGKYLAMRVSNGGASPYNLLIGGARSYISGPLGIGEQALPGDANGDGNINALDITKVERVIAGLDQETPGADANEDGNMNALDITKVERLIAGLG